MGDPAARHPKPSPKRPKIGGKIAGGVRRDKPGAGTLKGGGIGRRGWVITNSSQLRKPIRQVPVIVKQEMMKQAFSGGLAVPFGI